MSDSDFIFCWLEAQKYDNKDEYISALSESNIFRGNVFAPERIRVLGEIYDGWHRTVREIAVDVGMSRRKLAERFGVPHSTMDYWAANPSAMPAYTKLMMQEALGLIKR